MKTVVICLVGDDEGIMEALAELSQGVMFKIGSEGHRSTGPDGSTQFDCRVIDEDIFDGELPSVTELVHGQTGERWPY